MLSIAFIMSFVVAAVSLILGIFIYSEVSDGLGQTFGELLITETNSTEYTNLTPIVHAFDEVTIAETHTGDSLWTTIPNISLSSGEFTAGNKYLIMFRSEVRGDEDSNNGNGFNGANFGMRSLHGSTEFVGSELSFAHRTVGQSLAYNYFTVWTAVGGEDLTMEFIIHNKDSREVRANNISITAIELENFIEGEDYFFNTRVATDVLECVVFQATSCPIVGDWTQTNPSITWISNGSDDWLVMGNSQLNPDGKGDFLQTRLNLDDTTLTSEHRVVSEDNTAVPEDYTRHVPYFARVYTPSAGSHTVEIESSQNGQHPTQSPGPGKRLYGSIFAINLDQFEYHTDSYNPFTNITPINNWIETGTMTVDSPSVEDTFIMGFQINQNGVSTSSNSDPRSRMQIDGQDIWIEGTSPSINNKGLTGTSQTLTTMVTMENLSGSTTVDIDTLNSFIRPELDTQLVAISMSAKTYEFEDQTPDAFTRADAIAFTILAIVPITLFFALFTLFSPRIDGDAF